MHPARAVTPEPAARTPSRERGVNDAPEKTFQALSEILCDMNQRLVLMAEYLTPERIAAFEDDPEQLPKLWALLAQACCNQPNHLHAATQCLPQLAALLELTAKVASNSPQPTGWFGSILGSVCRLELECSPFFDRFVDCAFPHIPLFTGHDARNVLSACVQGKVSRHDLADALAECFYSQREQFKKTEGSFPVAVAAEFASWRIRPPHLMKLLDIYCRNQKWLEGLRDPQFVSLWRALTRLDWCHESNTLQLLNATRDRFQTLQFPKQIIIAHEITRFNSTHGREFFPCDRQDEVSGLSPKVYQMYLRTRMALSLVQTGRVGPEDLRSAQETSILLKREDTPVPPTKSEARLGEALKLLEEKYRDRIVVSSDVICFGKQLDFLVVVNGCRVNIECDGISHRRNGYFNGKLGTAERQRDKLLVSQKILVLRIPSDIPYILDDPSQTAERVESRLFQVIEDPRLIAIPFEPIFDRNKREPLSFYLRRMSLLVEELEGKDSVIFDPATRRNRVINVLKALYVQLPSFYADDSAKSLNARIKIRDILRTGFQILEKNGGRTEASKYAAQFLNIFEKKWDHLSVAVVAQLQGALLWKAGHREKAQVSFKHGSMFWSLAGGDATQRECRQYFSAYLDSAECLGQTNPKRTDKESSRSLGEYFSALEDLWQASIPSGINILPLKLRIRVHAFLRSAVSELEHKMLTTKSCPLLLGFRLAFLPSSGETSAEKTAWIKDLNEIVPHAVHVLIKRGDAFMALDLLNRYKDYKNTTGMSEKKRGSGYSHEELTTLAHQAINSAVNSRTALEESNS